MDIIKFYQRSSHNEEHYQRYADVLALFDTNDVTTMGVTADQLQAFKDLHAKEDIVLEPYRKSGLTEKIKEADERRDITYRGFKNAVKNILSNSTDQNKIEAAKNLTLVFDQFRDPTKKNLVKQTAIVNNIINDINDRCMADINLLQLEEWLDKLTDYNNECQNLINQRFEEKSNKPKTKMPEMRKEIDAIYNNIVKAIEVFMDQNPNHGIDPFISNLNEITNYYKNIISQRKGRAKAAKERQEQSTEDTMLDTLNNNNQHHQPHWTPVPPRDNDKPFEK